MTDAEFERVRRDGHEGLYECSLCRKKVDFGSALTVWHAGAPFFGVCTACADARCLVVVVSKDAFHVRLCEHEGS